MKKNTAPFIPINPHQLAVFFKDTTHRVLMEIRRGRAHFTAYEKESDYKSDIDFFTDVDKKCQQIWLKHCKEQYPFIGIIAEEEDLRIPCSTKADAEYFFTIDPLDGTKAFMRGQSEGFSTMISLIRKSKNKKNAPYEIIGACIGDVMTQEIYYYRMSSKKTHRLEPDQLVRELHPSTVSLKEQYILLRDDPRTLSEIAQQLTFPETGAFKNIEVAGGSIGTNTAKLWKGQCGAYILNNTYDTPWDWNPVAGISKRLGFKMFEIIKNGLGKEIPLDGIIEKTKRENERIIVHESHVKELQKYFKKFNK
ncbi:MAG: inositol monophosphatase family protein [bacterium]